MNEPTDRADLESRWQANEAELNRRTVARRWKIVSSPAFPLAIGVACVGVGLFIQSQWVLKAGFIVGFHVILRLMIHRKPQRA